MIGSVVVESETIGSVVVESETILTVAREDICKYRIDGLVAKLENVVGFLFSAPCIRLRHGYNNIWVTRVSPEVFVVCTSNFQLFQSRGTL